MKSLFMCVALIIIFAMPVLALAPPHEIERSNLAADLIVYGKVNNIVFDKKKSHFQIDIRHIIKGSKIFNKNTVTVFCEMEAVPENSQKITAHSQGSVNVSVKKGDFVIAYLKLNKNQQYIPVLKGLSVIIAETIK